MNGIVEHFKKENKAIFVSLSRTPPWSSLYLSDFRSILVWKWMKSMKIWRKIFKIILIFETEKQTFSSPVNAMLFLLWRFLSRRHLVFLCHVCNRTGPDFSPVFSSPLFPCFHSDVLFLSFPRWCYIYILFFHVKRSLYVGRRSSGNVSDHTHFPLSLSLFFFCLSFFWVSFSSCLTAEWKKSCKWESVHFSSF